MILCFSGMWWPACVLIIFKLTRASSAGLAIAVAVRTVYDYETLAYLTLIPLFVVYKLMLYPPMNYVFFVRVIYYWINPPLMIWFISYPSFSSPAIFSIMRYASAMFVLASGMCKDTKLITCVPALGRIVRACIMLLQRIRLISFISEMMRMLLFA